MAQLKETTIIGNSSTNPVLNIKQDINTSLFKITTGTSGSELNSLVGKNVFEHDIYLEDNKIHFSTLGTLQAINSETLKWNNYFIPLRSSDYKTAASNNEAGSALAAKKLVEGDTVESTPVSKGTSTQPIYFEDGVPVAIAYTIKKSVPSDAKFSDTTYESIPAAPGGNAVSLVTTGEKYTWNNKSNLGLVSSGGNNGYSASAARSDHVHDISIVPTTAVLGVSTVNLGYNATYTLTAGGKSVIFKTVPKQTVSTTNLTVYYSDGTSGTLTVATGIN